jgi:predicted kinase
MSIAILIRGPLGVGKTTVAAELGHRLGARIISIDAILEENGLDQGSHGIPARNFLRANELALPTAQEALEAGRPVIFDGNFYYKSQVRHLLRRLPSPTYVFTLNAPVEECIARDSGREHVYGPESAAWVHYLVNRFNAGTPIETAGKDAGQVVVELVAYLPAEYQSIRG